MLSYLYKKLFQEHIKAIMHYIVLNEDMACFE